MKTKLLMERLDAIERQALETLKEVRAMREEMKASPRPSPKGKGEKPCEMKQTRHPADGLNDKAWGLMEKARNGGLLDAEYMPTGSRTEAALLAGAIAYEVNISKKWKVFESLWSMKRLDQAYFRAQYHPKSAEIMKTINNVLDSSFEME